MIQDQVNNTDAEITPEQPKQAYKVNTVTIIFIILVSIIALLVGFLAWRYYKMYTKCQNEKKGLQEQYDNLRSTNTDESEEVTKDNIENKTKDNSDGQTEEDECSVSFTEEEQLMMDGWKTYENEVYNYSFKYPQDWELTGSGDTVSVKTDSYGAFKFDFYSEDATEREIEYPMIKRGESTTNVYCIEAQKLEYGGDAAYEPEFETFVTIAVILEHNDISYRLEISYSIEGAALSSDFADMYNLILKTVEFE